MLYCRDTLGGGGRGEEVVGRTLALLMEFRRLETLLKNISGVELKVEDVRPAGEQVLCVTSHRGKHPRCFVGFRLSII